MSKYCLVGVDGNAFAIMSYVSRAMRKEHYSKSEIDSYLDDCMSSDYDHLLQVSVEMCNRLNGEN